MAIERIDIVIRETGGQVTSRTVREVGEAAEETGQKVEKTNSILTQFKGILAGLGVGATIHILQNAADTYTTIQNQLRLVTRNSAELATVEERLFRISQDTTTSFRANVDVYAQLRQGAAQYGASTQDVLDVTNNLALALNATGKSSSEVQGAMAQLAKSVAQGEVGGRALVAVFQQIPLVARAVAQNLHVSIDALNNMAAAGTLTGKELFDALKQSDLITQASAQKVDTFADAWGNVTNAFVRYIGQLNNARGIMALVMEALLLLADHMALVGNVVITGIATWAAYRAAIFAAALTMPIFTAAAAGATGATAAFTIASNLAAISVGTLIGVVRGLFLLLLAHPFIFLATALAGIIVAIYQFGNAIQIGGISPLAALRAAIDLVSQGWQAFVIFIQPAINFIKAVWAELVRLGTAIAADQPTYETLRLVFIGIATAIAIALLPGIALATAAFIGIGEVITVLNGGALGDFTNKVIEAGVALKDKFAAAATEAQKAIDAGTSSNQNYVGSLDDIRRSTGATTQSMRAATQAAREANLEFGSAAELHKRWADRIKKDLDDAMKKLHELSEAEKQAALVHRNAMGDMITVTDEWAFRSGKNFNRVSDAARQTADDVSQTATRIQDTMQRAVNWDPNRGSGTPGGTGTITYQTTESVTEAHAMILQALQNFRAAKDPVAQANAKVDLLKAFNYASFNTGNTGGFPNVSVLQAKLGLMNLVRDAGKLLDLQGFAYGGSFKVGGSGGSDSQLVQFMASPNERVHVETQRQYEDRTRARSSGGRPIVINMNVSTPDSNSFRRSETQISQALMNKLGRAAERF